MNRLLSAAGVLLLAGVSLNLSAQQTPSPDATTPTTQSPSTTPDNSAQQPVNSQSQTAQSFQGKITKSGDKLVLRDSATQASYQLDDQEKAKQYEGKNVKVMATMDPNTNTLHVVDITPSQNQ
jgi:hypothetical protein